MILDTYPSTAKNDFEFPDYSPDQSAAKEHQPGVQIPEDTTILEMFAHYRYGRRADNQAVINIQSD